MFVRLVSQNLTGVECPRESSREGSDDAGTAVSSSAAETAPTPTKRTLRRYNSDPAYRDDRSDEVQRERQEIRRGAREHGHLYGLAAVND